MGQPAGTEVPILWRGRRARAFVPARLADRDLGLEEATVAAAARAGADVTRAAAALGSHDFAALARLLLRAEAVASSFIEGVSAPAVDVVLAEAEPNPGPGAASWVAANLAAVTGAVATAATPSPLSVEALCGWHRTLMTAGPTPARYVGVVRSEPGWIGGHDPTDAHLVTPPPDYVPGLVEDLVAYANRTDVDPVTQAAVSHAQFEVVHPFADGNGRVGRILASWILTRRLSLVVPPPVSVAIAASVGGYTSGLTMFRFGDHNAWVRWFAEAVSGAGGAQEALVGEVERLRAAWRDRLAARPGRTVRSDAAAWELLDVLPRHVVLAAPAVADALGITPKASRDALDQLVEAGVLTRHGTAPRGGRGRPATLYVSPELLALTGSSPLR